MWYILTTDRNKQISVCHLASNKYLHNERTCLEFKYLQFLFCKNKYKGFFILLSTINIMTVAF